MAQRQTTTPWRFLIHKKDSFHVRLSKRVRHWFWKRTGRKTASGKLLTDADIVALADEAERGYDIDHLVDKRRDKT